MMAEPLPTLGKQKRHCYRTNQAEATKIFRIINEEIFDNALAVPQIIVKSHLKKYWGMTHGEIEKMPRRNTRCWIELMDKFYCKQWMITILAHEMVHQAQWDIDGPIREAEGRSRLLSHGPSFFKFRDKFAEHGISLKKWHRRNKWFRTQNLFR
jgi:hypothetical protein